MLPHFRNVLLDGLKIGEHHRERKRNRRELGHDLTQDLLIFQLGVLFRRAFRQSRLGIANLAPVNAQTSGLLRLNSLVAHPHDITE